MSTTATNNQEITLRLRTVLTRTLGVDITSIPAEGNLVDTVGPRYDSLAALEVITAVENEFGVEVDFVADDIRHSFSTLEHMTRFVSGRLEDSAALGSRS